MLNFALEANRYKHLTNPLRKIKVISIIFKAEKKQLFNKVTCYLHVKKPDWDSFAFIGSVLEDEKNALDAAKIALKEACSKIILMTFL